MRRWAEWMIALGLCVAPAAGAGEPEPKESEQAKFLELLEFLGSWETDDGEWVSPFTFHDEPAADAGDESKEKGDE